MVLPDSEDSSFNDCPRKLSDPSFNQFPKLQTPSNSESRYSGFYENETLSTVSNVCPMEVDSGESKDCVYKITPVDDTDILKNSHELHESNINISDESFVISESHCLQNSEEKDESQLMIIDSSVQDTPTNSVKTRREKLQVRCLQSIESLREVCESQGLIFNEDSVDDAAYEVDMIFAHKIENRKIFYHIKWKNYSSDHNTWEPSSNLFGCQETIRYYRAMQGSTPKVDIKLLNYFVRDLISRKPYDILTMIKACALCFGTSEMYVTSLNLTISQMKAKIREILSFSSRKLLKLQSELFEIMRFGEARKQVLINLKEWQSKINSDNKAAYIEVENNVDLETAPVGFTFINNYINSVVTVPEEPLTFCNCNNCYKEKDSCCPHDSEGHFAYNKYQRLILRPGYPIFECNGKCRCDTNCVNRVVQHGQKVKVAIFRTANGCGWGLKTLETIEKGQFVLEYLGEIITSEEAEARGHIYDYIGRSYLFDLDYGVENTACCYTVDAGHVGNAAHFINHSCDPNLHVFAVWINQPDPNLPRLAFFAKRKICRGEELTFDYKMEDNRFGPHSSEEQFHERISCQCNSKNCRKFLF